MDFRSYQFQPLTSKKTREICISALHRPRFRKQSAGSGRPVKSACGFPKKHGGRRQVSTLRPLRVPTRRELTSQRVLAGVRAPVRPRPRPPRERGRKRAAAPRPPSRLDDKAMTKRRARLTQWTGPALMETQHLICIEGPLREIAAESGERGGGRPWPFSR